MEPRSPALWADSLPAEPPGKPENTGVGSLSLHQRIFPAQESNWGLLRCRRILYQLSYMMKTAEAKDVALGKYVIGFASGQDVRDTFIRKHYHLELKSKLLLPHKYLLLTFTK